ncbi:hypothetical protein GO986_09525 [Deinococcus sp. HMF7620]|uniref:Uncharacterized protein n=1 Tax=Deinococcus arboris TaxID=2682977 RepID=A0A7C9M687_9DEIO|nr:hypothetical protein [Deinococcus arboris]MVN87005.1 hypothetical protein [Deinococcus arboris]
MLRRTWQSATALLVLAGGNVQAQSTPVLTPLTLKGFQDWVNRVCASGCTEVKPATLLAVHGEQLLPGGKVFLVRRGQERFYLAYDLGTYNGQLDLSQIAFFPVRLQDRWTPQRLETVAAWFKALAGGQADAKKLWTCVESLKRNQVSSELFDNGYGKTALGILKVGPQGTTQGKCFWLKGDKAVGFGFRTY